MHPAMAIAVSLDGYCFNLGMASWDGDLSIPGWRSMHPGMAIVASVDGHRYTTGWRRSIPGWRSMHPGMVIMHPRMVTIASREGDLETASNSSRDSDRCIPGW